MLYFGLRVSKVEELKLSDVKINGNTKITIREGKHGKYATVTLLIKHSRSLRSWLKYRQQLENKYAESAKR